MSGFTAVGFFITSLLFGIIIFSIWLRMALRYLRVSTLNAFSQLIYSVTNPLINPIHWVFKQKIKLGHKYEWVAFGVLILIELLKIISLSLLMFHAIIPLLYIVLYVMADLIIQPCDLLFYAVLVRVIMNYTNPGWQHPMAAFLRLITEPLFNLGRRIVPDISGFDFSPFIALILLKIISLFITASLPWRLL